MATREITTAPLAPPMPPPSAEEIADSERTCAMLRELIEIAQQRNLDNALILAEMARQRRLPKHLEDHFGELGRRYYELVRDRDKKKQTTLRVVEGGAA